MTAALAPVLATIGKTPETEPPYTSMEMVALSGCSYRQLDYWARTHRLTDTAQGSGMAPRSFTAEDLMVVSLVVVLIHHFSVNEAFDIARHILDDGEFRTLIGRGYELLVRPEAER